MNYIIWSFVFNFAFIWEAWHDWYWSTRVHQNCQYNFVAARWAKILKGLGWTWGILLISYLAGNYWLILIYWGEKFILFHPYYRLFSHGWRWVFSMEGLIWMIKHSEVWYWYEIIFTHRRG